MKRKHKPDMQARRRILRAAAAGAASLATGEVSFAEGAASASADRGVFDVVIIGAGLAG